MEELQMHTFNVYRFILRSKKALSQSPFLVFSGTLAFGSPSCTETSAIPKFSFVKEYDAVWFTAACSLQVLTHTPWSIPDGTEAVCSAVSSPECARCVSAFRDIRLCGLICGTGA